MGRIFSSLVKRPVKNWNISSRAEAELKREKPAVAPRHPTTQKVLEQFQKEHPELLEAQKLKDDKLLTNLQDLVVEPDKFGEILRAEKKNLPEDRRWYKDPDYGFIEPDTIPQGRCTVRQALEFITSYQVEPRTFTATRIASDYKLDSVRVQDVLGHFQIHMLQIPGHTMDKVPTDSPKAALGSGGTGALLGSVMDKVRKKPQQEQTTTDSSKTSSS